jgi:RND superfamily putative drug exporter
MLIGGGHVAESDWARTLYGNFPLAISLVYLATFILLGIIFRSIVIPLKAILLNTLTVAAAFGVVTAIFQFGWAATLFGLPAGLGFVDTSVPFFIFAIVFGISMDYEVFLVSRVVEGHLQGKDDNEAVVYALSATGGVITSAATIMFVVFAAFVFSEVVLIKSLSLGLSVAVLLDATLVRLVLVPAMMAIAGRWNWWLPKPLQRLVERAPLGH